MGQKIETLIPGRALLGDVAFLYFQGIWGMATIAASTTLGQIQGMAAFGKNGR